LDCSPRLGVNSINYHKCIADASQRVPEQANHFDIEPIVVHMTVLNYQVTSNIAVVIVYDQHFIY